jgi:DNA-binding NtrC family response regulator
MQKPKPAYPAELLTLLSTYHFPGNVRELRSMVYDALATHQKGILSMERFKEAIMKEATVTDRETPSESLPRDDCLVSVFGRFPTLKEVEDFLIAEAMRLSKGNQGIAASLLGITRQALNKRIVRARQQRD